MNVGLVDRSAQTVIKSDITNQFSTWLTPSLS